MQSITTATNARRPRPPIPPITIPKIIDCKKKDIIISIIVKNIKLISKWKLDIYCTLKATQKGWKGKIIYGVEHVYLARGTMHHW